MTKVTKCHECQCPEPATQLAFYQWDSSLLSFKSSGDEGRLWTGLTESSRHAFAASTKSGVGFALTVLCTGLAPSPAVGQAGRNPGADQIPLERYERIVQYKNGCNAIVRLGETAPDSQTRWYGGCRFGLAHGKGIYRLDWTIDGLHSFATSPVQMYYGRWQGPPEPGGSLKPGAKSITLSRGVSTIFKNGS